MTKLIPACQHRPLLHLLLLMLIIRIISQKVPIPIPSRTSLLLAMIPIADLALSLILIRFVNGSAGIRVAVVVVGAAGFLVGVLLETADWGSLGLGWGVRVGPFLEEDGGGLRD
jgi:hypothetical protein